MAMNRSNTWGPASYLPNNGNDYVNYIEMDRSTTTGAEIYSDGFPTQFPNTSQAHIASSAPCTEQSVWSKPGIVELPMMQSPHCTDVSTEKNIDAETYDVQDFVNRNSYLNSRAPPIAFLPFSNFVIPTSYSHLSPTFTAAPSLISDHSTSPSLSRTISMNSGFSSFNIPSSVPNMARVKSAPEFESAQEFEFSTDPSQQRNSRFPSAGGSSRRVSNSSHLHDMQRSSSNASNSSCSSSTSKKPAGRSRRKVPPSCTIAPKKDTATITFGNPDGSHMVRVKSSDGTSKDFGVLSKLSTPAPSRRRQGSTPSAGYAHPHVKPRCDRCNEVPQGFRGEHELMRHYNLRHRPVQTFWICVDPTPGAKFLSKCHHCESKKRYGQYYNAAAHLRRVHFQPRRRGRKAKNAKVEKRRPGFIDYDNTPKMEELKRSWLKQVHIKNENADVDEEVEEVGSVIEGEDHFDGVAHVLSKKSAHPIIYDGDMEADEDDIEGQVEGMAYDIDGKYFSRESAKRYWEDDPIGLLHGVGAGPDMKIMDVDPLHLSSCPIELSWGPST